MNKVEVPIQVVQAITGMGLDQPELKPNHASLRSVSTGTLSVPRPMGRTRCTLRSPVTLHYRFRRSICAAFRVRSVSANSVPRTARADLHRAGGAMPRRPAAAERTAIGLSQSIASVEQPPQSPYSSGHGLDAGSTPLRHRTASHLASPPIPFDARPPYAKALSMRVIGIVTRYKGPSSVGMRQHRLKTLAYIHAQRAQPCFKDTE